MPVATPGTAPSSVPAASQGAAPASIPAATPVAPGTLQSIPAATPAKRDTLPSIPAATKAQPDTVPAVAPAQPAEKQSLLAMPPYAPEVNLPKDHLGSTYIPVDSPIYAMAVRLYSLGYLDSAFISMRPWTRRSLLHMLEKTQNDAVRDGDVEAESIVARLEDMLADESRPGGRGTVYGIDTVYARVMGINGLPLRDGYHLGQTIVNDYGRPYAEGFNALAGFSSVNEWGRFSLYVRGEYQHAPSWDGYSFAMAQQLSCTDEICPFLPPNNPQATIPYGKYVDAQNPFRLQEATLSFHLLGHEFSGGKSDVWQGPGLGGAMGWSNNAENIYSFRINRVEPLYIPLISRILGPLRYDFFVGSLQGHTAPNNPWVHSEQFSLRPTKNFEFAFQRTVIWGGKDHQPVTLHTFLRSFFSLVDTQGNPGSKLTADDPGARFSSFSFSYRLPWFARGVTLYTDMEAHDDVSPVSAPRRAAYRPGILFSHLPGMPRMEFRVEGMSTDSSTRTSDAGRFMYYEVIQRQGYTNKGQLFGDWVGR
ncbi:MAG: capsule assembly Wzi family protein, partial [Bryocella sp.]